jgi:hypothetical protein
MSNPRIIYRLREDATPESELSALAEAYEFILASAMKKAAPASRPDARKEDLNDSGYEQYTRH